MLQNFANEAIVLIAAILALVVILGAQEDFEMMFSVKSGVLYMIVSTMIVFVASAGQEMLLMFVFTAAVISIFARADTLARAARTHNVGGWIIFALRLITHGDGFSLKISTANIIKIALILFAAVETAIMVWKLHRSAHASAVDDGDDEEDEDDEKTTIRESFAAFIKANPAKSYLAAMVTLVIVVFAVCAIRATF